jgi:2-polyprenyl-6-methoxyphenol hydroxylase-like FAD-dependent oxidoreductase
MAVPTCTRPVVVVGGGPTGLTAALELAYHGVPSIVVDAGGPRSDGSRAIAIHRTALAVWEKLRCAEPMLATGLAWQARRTFYRGRELYAQLMPTRAPGELPAFLNLPQYQLEACLVGRIGEVDSIELRWQHRVTAVTQDSDGVTVEVETPDGPIELRASYVLACDGARSATRKFLGAEFPGSTYQDRFLIADIRADLPFPPEPRFFFDHPTNPGSTILVHPQPDGVWRIDWQLRGTLDVAAERAPAALDRRIRGVIGDVPYELVWLSDYRFHQRLLERLRHGRVFFLGDAAHLVAPFGARGMNGAIHDVENLGWKLAATLRGEASPELLDTYQAERWPAQHHNQLVTDATMRFMAPRTAVQRTRRAATLWLSTWWPAARRWVDSGKMSEPFTYTESPAVTPDDAAPDEWRGAPLPGSKAPDAACTFLAAREEPAGRVSRSAGGTAVATRVTGTTGSAPTRLGTPIRLRRLFGAGFVALYFAVDAESGTQFREAALRHGAPGNVTVWPVVPIAYGAQAAVWDRTGEVGRVYAGQPGTLYVVRPDGHVSGRRRAAGPGEVAELVQFALSGGTSPVSRPPIMPEQASTRAGSERRVAGLRHRWRH